MSVDRRARHTQTEIHTLFNYNKYYSGFHNYQQMHDRVWYLSVPKSFFDDALASGPFEFLIAIGFSFEYLLTNLLFVPLMSGASFNGDLPTMTFGFSAQSDESRHMTLGLEAIKSLLEQDEANVPIVQAWIDKWFWRGYRVTALIAQMLDYMLPRKVMSWKEAFELYFEDQMLKGLFADLAFYGNCHGRRPEPDSGQSRTRWQERKHRLRGRQTPERDRLVDPVHLPQRGPDLPVG